MTARLALHFNLSKTRSSAQHPSSAFSRLQFRSAVSTAQIGFWHRTRKSSVPYLLMLSVLPAVGTAARPLYVYVLQCLMTYIVDHRPESHRVCSAASVMSKYGQQSRVTRVQACPPSHSASSHRTLSSSTLMSTAHASSFACSPVTLHAVHHALKDQFAWSVVTLMSPA